MIRFQNIILDLIAMISSKNEIYVFMVGRIYEEDQVFKLIEQASSIFHQNITTHLFFTDSRTKVKMSTFHPQYHCSQFKKDEHSHIINYIVSIGGDGTILYSAKFFNDQVPPLISFQRGSLGFMCRFRIQQIEQVLLKIVSYHKNPIECPFQEVRLIRLESIQAITSKKLKEEKHTCINEIYISRKTHQRITFLTSTAGDGILISTPTGSTAYSLSAGGPILQNGVNGILIVPIAPNSISFRPLCLPSDSIIKIKLSKSSRSGAYVSFDGQQTNDFNQKQEQITIKRSKHDIIFFEPKKGEMNAMPTWIQRLKYFLGWNEKYKTPISEYKPQINTHINKFQCQEQQG